MYKCVYTQDTRSVSWVYDPKGYIGKSTFTMFAEVLLNAHILLKSTSRDMTCSIVKIANDIGCYIFVLPRGKGSQSPIEDVLTLAEELKNGYVFSPMVMFLALR